jgi:hypothetical protein
MNEDIVCHDCSNTFPEDEGIEMNGDTYCLECAIICENCSTTEPRDNMLWVSGSLWCNNCATSCVRCDEGMSIEDTHSVDDEVWCQSCYEDYSFYCDRCENTYSDNCGSNSVGNDTICEDCYSDSAYYCDDCDESSYDDYPCACREGMSGRPCRCRSIVHDYNCKPPVTFKGESRRGLYLGFELETIINGDYRLASEYASTALEGIAMLKQDGSIGSSGFEIVTEPHSHLEYRENSKILWDTIEELRKDHGARSWDTESCGLHIHISRAGFSSGAHTHRFLSLVYKNSEMMMKFAGRKSRYARFNDVYTFDEYDKPVFSLKHKVKVGESTERYSAVNTNNRDTLELRFFKGTMNTSGVLSALDLAQAMVEYTRELRLDDVKRGALSWEWFADYVVSNNGLYPDLYSRLNKISGVNINRPIEMNA